MKKILMNGDLMCGLGLLSFYAAYAEYINPSLFFTVTIIGSTLNTLNIIVFTRKSMISPNNLIFAHLAIVDLASLITYMPRWANETIRRKMYSVKEHRIYEWETIGMYSYLVSSTFHAISIWLAIMLAVWRYIAIVHPLKERQWCNLKTTKIFIAVGYVTCSLGIIPGYFSLEVQAFDRLLDSDGYITWNRTIGIPTKVFLLQPAKSSRAISILSALAAAVFVKIIPMVLVSVYSYKCIVALQRAKIRRKKLTIRSHESNTTNTRKNLLTDRTTRMLLVILALFFIPEMPTAIACILIVIFGPKFSVECYSYFFEIFNAIVLICTSCNFIVYYTMSGQFHDTFIQLFSSKPPSV
ncbi:G-protein coupled receptor dmsr-1-like [Planococcus citri]|uniref:G-protein coupled receptor dmsr-1-like n=1 Tax=Planococcus citri TaxID=170843 RepID=UPI0031F78E41